MIFLLDTSTSECEMSLYAPDQELITTSWSAHRELADRLLEEIDLFLAKHDMNIQSLNGLVVYKGPGSFTGLRIGITVMNTLADGLNIPIVGLTGEDWRQKGIAMLEKGNTHHIVLPEYGSLPNITKPKK